MPVLAPHYLIPDRPLESLAEYFQLVGGSAVEKAKRLGPEGILQEIQRSGLRGRGGAGFPTGTKWGSVRSQTCKTRFVICNAAEGEPGTFKDRWILRHNPYALIEGMLIAAEAVEATRLIIAIKASYRKEIDRLKRAIDEAVAAKLLGQDTLQVVEGPDEYLYGEEKALLEVISGNDPLPRSPDEPPYEVGPSPSVGSPNPAVVNNVETLSRVPGIIRYGAASFRELGTHDTPGLLIFTISGDVQRAGVFELAAGTPLRVIFEQHAGGPKAGRSWKAALSGVSTSVLPAERFDTPADFGSLALAGSGLGSAGFVLYGDSASMPRVAQMVARFLYVESCNQCSACKQGLRTASHSLDGLFNPATARLDLVAQAQAGARSAPQGNRCYLPVQGSMLIPSLIARFESEFVPELAQSGRAAAVPVPKLLDYDPATFTFTLDERQALKKPDWTYGPPGSEVEPPPARPAESAPAVDDGLKVHLPADLAAQLHQKSQALGRPVHHLVEEILRKWHSEN